MHQGFLLLRESTARPLDCPRGSQLLTCFFLITSLVFRMFQMLVCINSRDSGWNGLSEDYEKPWGQAKAGLTWSTGARPEGAGFWAG